VVICLERDADLHTAQLTPLSLTVSCFSKIEIGFTFLVPAHPGSPGQRAVKNECVILKFFRLRGTIIIFVYNNNNNNRQQVSISHFTETSISRR